MASGRACVCERQAWIRLPPATFTLRCAALCLRASALELHYAWCVVRVCVCGLDAYIFFLYLIFFERNINMMNDTNDMNDEHNELNPLNQR